MTTRARRTSDEADAQTESNAQTKSNAADQDTDRSDAQVQAAQANRNAASFARTEETHAADMTVRGGGPNPLASSRDFPEAPSREDQEENARAAAELAAKNMTGTEDGRSSVLPAVGGTTNMALTPTEVQAQLDDGAVDARGRLTGTYLDDLQAEEAQRRRERVENAGSLDGEDAEMRRAAAARVRSLARSDVVSAADLGKAPGEQALVNTKKITGADQDDANDPSRRAGETAGKDQSAGTDNTRR